MNEALKSSPTGNYPHTPSSNTVHTPTCALQICAHTHKDTHGVGACLCVCLCGIARSGISTVCHLLFVTRKSTIRCDMRVLRCVNGHGSDSS